MTPNLNLRKIANLGKELGFSYQALYNSQIKDTTIKPSRYQVIPLRRWTVEEDRLVASISRRGEPEEVALVLNRTVASVRRRQNRLR